MSVKIHGVGNSKKNILSCTNYLHEHNEGILFVSLASTATHQLKFMHIPYTQK